MARQSLAAALTVVVIALAPLSARAFCGFYVGSADGSLVNEATMVVLLRDGTNTVLSMRNDYHGPPEDFAMVVPVPEVLDEDNVKVLDAAIFDKVERLAAPRLVEYWEQDPCAQPGIGENFGFGGLGLRGTGRGGGGTGEAAATVTVEAEFAVGEYDIVILSARDSAGLETWLHENDYRIPDGAAELLRPYVENESKFFVAKVNVDRVTFEDGRAVLSPLRVHYESESFSLPVRLGLLSAGEGKQDLIVHILANNQRYELANYDNVTIPTNLDVAPAARGRFGELYAALFDETLASHPNAVVTEYAWTASSCDPCPGPSLDAQDILTLGGDVVHDGPIRMSMGGGGTIGLGNLGTIGRPITHTGRVRSGAVAVDGSGLAREVARRVIRRHINEVRFCYEQGLTREPDLAGRVVLQLEVTSEGRVRASSITESEIDDDQVKQCLAQAGRRWSFPQVDGGGTVTITHPFVFSKVTAPPPSPRPSSNTLGLGGLGFFGGGAGPFNGWVLTRLHYRYDEDSLGEDLVFREADPIMGGREHAGTFGAPTEEPAEISHEAQSSESNNFQGRYVIRHEWEGPIECEEPRRGVWGGPWEGVENTGAGAGGSGALPATDLSQAPRGDASVLNALVVGRGGAAEPTPEEEEAEEAEPETETPAAESEAEESGCGCRVVAPASSSAGWLAILGFGIVWWRRRVVRGR
ncbi:MAG: DUF2330 domain-containing protein [Deltaproteobacteria bacterium]|nr:DUF2330 domain-containing protein [Deltaproteobacteria bacterium]